MCPTHLVLCFCFVCLCPVYPMLPVSLDYPFVIAPSVFSNLYIFVSHIVANKCITYNKQHTDWNFWKCYLTEMSTCNIHVFWPWHIFGSHWGQFLYTCLTVYSGEPKRNKIQSLYTYRNHFKYCNKQLIMFSGKYPSSSNDANMW